jgi:alpha 1,2-mannosyltransferase
MKAAFVSLIRNEELWEIVKSIRQIEDRFNRNYHYPWVFLNDVPFTQEFIDVTSALISGETKYGTCLRVLLGWGADWGGRTGAEGTLEYS